MNVHCQPLAADPELAKIIRFKSALIWEIRKYLHDNAALEIPMPILHRTREGAPVDQWSTVQPSKGDRWYLRHCMEDHLRRVSAAHTRVFEIGKAVRADAASPMHAHEFVILELVFRGFSYDEGINLIRGLISEAVVAAADAEYGTGDVFRCLGVRRWDEIFEEVTGLSVSDTDFIASCKKWLHTHGIVPQQPYSLDWEVLEDIMKYVIEPACIAPTMITNFPRQLQHVCTISPVNGRAQRVSTVMNGIEISDGGLKFSKSEEYRRIYIANAGYRKDILGLEGNELPEDFFTDIDAMCEPAFTTGMGIDRITALVAGCDIRRALIFPEG